MQCLVHTIFHHTIFGTQLCHTPSFATPSFAHRFVTHHLSHTTAFFHAQLSHRRSFTHNFVIYTIFFVAHHLSHTTLSHTHTHTIFLRQIQSFTYHFVTHNSSHPTCFTSRSSTTAFVFPSFPVPARTFVAHYWKKLTCGVIGSFN